MPSRSSACRGRSRFPVRPRREAWCRPCCSRASARRKLFLPAYGMIAALNRTMNYILNPANRNEVVQYVSTYHKINLRLAEKAFAAQMLGYSKDGTKPRAAVEKEIEIYRETLKIAKTFIPDDLEDMSLLRKVQSR